MNWKQLREQIDTLTDEQLETDVTVYDASEDEFFGIYSEILNINQVDDILDAGHPYLVIKEN